MFWKILTLPSVLLTNFIVLVLAIHGDVQGILLALHSKIIPFEAWGTIWKLEIEPMLFTYKASALPPYHLSGHILQLISIQFSELKNNGNSVPTLSQCLSWGYEDPLFFFKQQSQNRQPDMSLVYNCGRVVPCGLNSHYKDEIGSRKPLDRQSFKSN